MLTRFWTGHQRRPDLRQTRLCSPCDFLFICCQPLNGRFLSPAIGRTGAVPEHNHICGLRPLPEEACVAASCTRSRALCDVCRLLGTFQSSLSTVYKRHSLLMRPVRNLPGKELSGQRVKHTGWLRPPGTWSALKHRLCERDGARLVLLAM